MFNRVMDWSPWDMVEDHAINYPSPVNLDYAWGFGFLSLIFLVSQMISGICLAMHYIPHTSLAFWSVEHIMRDVNGGWLLRYIHANGASMFFLTVYIHIGRGLYYKSYRNIELWFSGIIIFVLMMGTAFMGYVLPWGQMSFWGATVITNLASAIPYVGPNIAYWLWGGFSVDNATLVRFFSLHYLLPFIILGLVISHIVLLHIEGSTNPLGLWDTFSDNNGLYPYFFIKDFFGLFCFFLIYFYFVLFNPNDLGHSDNYIKANAMVTPTSIVPEWYFLPYYAILRSVPDKLGGVLLMGASIGVLFILPFIPSTRTPVKFEKSYQIIFWIFITIFILLGWLGAQPAEEPYVSTCRILVPLYFSFFLIVSPIYYIFEEYIIKSIIY